MKDTECDAGSGVAGRHILSQRVAQWQVLPLQHSWRPWRYTFYVYDSLIEKCSTLSVVCACTGLTVFFSPKLSVGME
jgi:hypothetical protein